MTQSSQGAALPAFRPPATAWGEPTRPEAPPATEAPATDRPPLPRRPGAGGLLDAARQRLSPHGEATRTGTSSADGATEDRTAQAKPPKIDHELVKDAAAAVLGVIVLAATIAVRLRHRGQRALRPPTDQDIDTAAPALGRLLQRRLNLAAWGPDAIDVFTVAGTAGVYVNRGLFTVPVPTAAPAAPTDDLSEETYS